MQARYKQGQARFEETGSAVSAGDEESSGPSCEQASTAQDAFRASPSPTATPLPSEIVFEPISLDTRLVTTADVEPEELAPMSTAPVTTFESGEGNTQRILNPAAHDVDQLAQWKQLEDAYSDDAFNSEDSLDNSSDGVSTRGSPSLPHRSISPHRTMEHASQSSHASSRRESAAKSSAASSRASSRRGSAANSSAASTPRGPTPAGHAAALSRSHDYARAAQWDALASSMNADTYVHWRRSSPTPLTEVCGRYSSGLSEAEGDAQEAPPDVKKLSVLERISLARQALAT